MVTLKKYDKSLADFKRFRAEVYMKLLKRVDELPDISVTRNLKRKIEQHKNVHCFTNNQLFWVAQELKL
jgi:hypothetical protein